MTFGIRESEEKPTRCGFFDTPVAFSLHSRYSSATPKRFPRNGLPGGIRGRDCVEPGGSGLAKNPVGELVEVS